MGKQTARRREIMARSFHHRAHRGHGEEIRAGDQWGQTGLGLEHDNPHAGGFNPGSEKIFNTEGAEGTEGKPEQTPNGLGTEKVFEHGNRKPQRGVPCQPGATPKVSRAADVFQALKGRRNFDAKSEPSQGVLTARRPVGASLCRRTFDPLRTERRSGR